MTTTIDSIDGLDWVFADIDRDFRDLDFEPTLAAELDRLEEDHAAGFDAEESPAGDAWPPLAASTIARKGHDRILVDTGRLRESLIGSSGDAIRAVSHRGLLFGTEVPYSIFHQEPTRLPRRQHVGITDDRLDKLTGDVADHAAEGLADE